MIKGLGNDIIEVPRIEKIMLRYGPKFLDKVFTVTEQAYCLKYVKSSRHFAGRFAAKEAIVKALGTGFGKDVSFLDIEIVNDASGKPIVQLAPEVTKRLGNPQVHLSISHCNSYATAVAIVT